MFYTKTDLSNPTQIEKKKYMYMDQITPHLRDRIITPAEEQIGLGYCWLDIL